jgi:hypothetical protein
MSSIDNFFRTQNNRILGELIEAEFPELTMINGNIIPLDTNFSDIDDTYSFSFITKLGSAALIAGCASDVPRVTSFTDKRAGRFQLISTSYAFCREDLRKAQARGVNLEATDAMIANEVLKQTADQTLVYGVPQAGLYGLLSQPNATISNLPADGQLNVSGNGPNSFRWSDKTGEQILRDLCLLSQTPRSLSNGVMFHNVMYLGLKAFDKLSCTVAPGVTSGETLLSFFLRTQQVNPRGIREVIPMAFLDGEGTAGSDMVITLNNREGNIKAVMVAGVQVEEYDDQLDKCVRLSHSLGSVIQLKNLAIQYASV